MHLIQQTLNALGQAGVYALFGAGFSLLLGNLRVLNVAHAGVFTLAAVGGVLLGDSFGGAVVGLFAAAVVGALASAAVEAVAYRPLRRRERDPLEAQLAGILTGLGAFFILQGLARVWTDARNISPSGTFLGDTIVIVEGELTTSYSNIVILLAAVLAIGGLHLFLKRTRMGLSIRAVGHAPDVSNDIGVPVGRVATSAFVLVGVLAGVGGYLIGLHTSVVNFTMGMPFLLIGFIVAVLGGFGSVIGTALAAAMVALAEVMIVDQGWGSFRGAILGALLLIVLLVRPSGLLGRPEGTRA